MLESCSNLRVSAFIPRDDSRTGAEMFVNSSWFAAVTNPGFWEVRLLKVTAGPSPTLSWKCRVALGKI